MILSGRDIEWYVKQGKLVINPVKQEQFQQNGIDLILDSIEHCFDEPLIYFEDNFSYLGTTLEWIGMPDDLMAFVEIRSTWGRNGLILPPTIIDAGFYGNITLEIFKTRSYKPQKPVAVPYGQRFAHIVFAKLTSPSIPYNGKYQNQKGITPAIEDK